MSTAARRCLTLPIYFALAALVPLLLLSTPLVGLIDVAGQRRWAGVRALLFLSLYVVCEAVGVVAAGYLWVAYRLGAVSRDGYLRANFRLQCRWAGVLLACVQRIFRIAVAVDTSKLLDRGPIVVFARHASSADTILPAVLISARHDIVLRYVLKRELLWDPCLDIVGNRLSNYFVDRHSTDSAAEIEAVARLADDLGEREGVLIFPEGTRYSPAKRERALRALRRHGDGELSARASSMRHVLPPKLGGPAALLQRNPRTDLIVLAHTGFEGVERMSDIFNGALIGRVIHVRLWRFARSEIPTDRRDLALWLFDRWKMVDDWIGAMRPSPAGAATQTTPCAAPMRAKRSA